MLYNTNQENNFFNTVLYTDVIIKYQTWYLNLNKKKSFKTQEQCLKVSITSFDTFWTINKQKVNIGKTNKRDVHFINQVKVTDTCKKCCLAFNTCLKFLMKKKYNIFILFNSSILKKRAFLFIYILDAQRSSTFNVVLP